MHAKEIIKPSKYQWQNAANKTNKKNTKNKTRIPAKYVKQNLMTTATLTDEQISQLIMQNANILKKLADR